MGGSRGTRECRTRPRGRVRIETRHCSREIGVPPSPLCWADKLATALYPAWLFLFLARLSGEIGEYLARAREDGSIGPEATERECLATLQTDWRRQAYEYGDR
jgi:hypothetical protein